MLIKRTGIAAVLKYATGISNLYTLRLLAGGWGIEKEDHPICPKFVVLRASYEKAVKKVLLQSWVAGEVLIFPNSVPALTRESEPKAEKRSPSIT